MDTLKNKTYKKYAYTCRYTNIPSYYDTLKDREISGIGQNLSTITSWVAHKVSQEDTLDSLALKYYNNPTYYWIIAYFNDIQDPFMHLADRFDIIKVPAMASIEFITRNE